MKRNKFCRLHVCVCVCVKRVYIVHTPQYITSRGYSLLGWIDVILQHCDVIAMWTDPVWLSCNLTIYRKKNRIKCVSSSASSNIVIAFRFFVPIPCESVSFLSYHSNIFNQRPIYTWRHDMYACVVYLKIGSVRFEWLCVCVHAIKVYFLDCRICVDKQIVCAVCASRWCHCMEWFYLNVWYLRWVYVRVCVTTERLSYSYSNFCDCVQCAHTVPV